MKKAAVIVFKIIFIGLIITAFIFGASKIYETVRGLFPKYQEASLLEIFGEGIDDDYTYVVYEDKALDLDYNPQIIEDKIYLPITFVIEYLNPNFYWDKNESTLTYTTAQDVIRMKSNEPLELDMPIIELDDSQAYIPLDLLRQFGEYEVNYNENLDLLIIDNIEKETVYGNVINKKAILRIKDSSKSRYIKKLELGESVRIYEEDENWYKVRTKEGYIGYIKKYLIGEIKIIPGKQKEPENNLVENKFDGKINLVWHQVTRPSGNNNIENLMKDTKYIDVISPTWFAISNSEGDVSNIADVSYVDWAHKQGYQVWALFSNSFDAKITHDVLSSTEKRERVIKQILAFADIYKLDGINIDFENVASEDGIYFVQFIKEITPYLKNQGLIVSVDMYVPSEWTKHYDRKQVGNLVDYIMIMAYDEHWSTSPKSGSVASIGFVNKGIIDTLKDVPKEKLILGLPYYTRLWKEELIDDAITVSSQAYGMNRAYEILQENDAEIIWNEEISQYYGEYILDNDIYKVWLEDERSIEEKLRQAMNYDLAGVAGWKLGLQKVEVWELIKLYLNKDG